MGQWPCLRKGPGPVNLLLGQQPLGLLWSQSWGRGKGERSHLAIWCTQPPPTQEQGTALRAPTPTWGESAAGRGHCPAWHAAWGARHTLTSWERKRGDGSGREGEGTSFTSKLLGWASPNRSVLMQSREAVGHLTG